MNESEKKLSGKSIDDKDLGEVTGGSSKGATIKSCPDCESKNFYCTGATKKAFFGLLTMYKWHCSACGRDTWQYSSK